ncbi:MAG TPA: HDOD domain-containing protein, partial [Planctomycetota bacterium]|nr:HDOD domain-containing protein [Planctomycetota bacterium]
MSESSWFHKVFRKLESTAPPSAHVPQTSTPAAAVETPWWEAADALAELADRAIEVPTAAEAALVARIDQRLRAEKYALPVLPETLVQVLELANRTDASIRDIAEAVQRDAVVTGEVLALVNSAAYLPASPIRDLPRAIVHVGVRRVRNLLLAVAARITVLRGADVARGRQLWMHSLATAILARAIARATASDPEEAFLAGLLHDIGKSVILGVVAEEERSSAAVVVPERLLRQLLDECHTGAGVRIARTWRLGERLEEAIEHHHG